MIKITESLWDIPVTVRHRNGEEIEYVSPDALNYKYILAKYSDNDNTWYYQNADDDIDKLRKIASHISWNKVEPWIVKAADCEII